ncbi:MAG: hypothetical protein K9N21_19260 [Deltaproteobacteria bacterium]|nr:hypothetical protein [Deltaproteobacteria bacterium]
MPTVYKTILRSLLIGAVAGLLGGAIAEWILPQSKVLPDDERIKAQIQKLDEMQGAMGELQDFLTQHREKLQKDKLSVDKLRKEKERLEPIVKVDKELVESILGLQQEQFRKQIWKERFIGFLIGFFSSLAASSVFIFLNRKKIIDGGNF